MDDHRLIAAAAATTPAVLIAGVACTPHDGDQHVRTTREAASELLAATQHHTGLLVGSTLVVFGLGLLAVGVAVIPVLVSGRGRRWALAAALLGGLGGFCGAVINSYVGLLPVALVDAHLSDAARQAALVGAQQQSGVLLPFAPGYFTGCVLAFVCAGVALWRSRLVPRWFAALLPVTFLVAFASSSGWDALLLLPWAGQMLFLARRAVSSRGEQLRLDPAAELALQR